MKLPEIYTLEKYNPANAIFVIGCGGTGAYAISHLARYMSVIGEKRNVQLILADSDNVEEKNLKRQHFVSGDIGRNKAEVLAERYSGAFGLEIAVLPTDIENAGEITKVFTKFNNSQYANMVITCVDNNASRKIVYNWFNDQTSHSHVSKFWIDSGNEEVSGQVVCGFMPSNSMYHNLVRPSDKKEKRFSGQSINPMSGIFSLPCAVEVYPELLEAEGKFNSQLSCAERAISAPQNMQTNVTAATLIMNFAQKVIGGNVIKSFGVEFSINNTFTTKHNTIENLSFVKEDRKAYWEK